MSDLVKLFFLCNQGLNTLLLVPHKAMLGIMATGCIFAKSEKGRGRKIIFSPQSWVRNFFLVKLETLYYQLVKKSDPPYGVLGHVKNALY